MGKDKGKNKGEAKPKAVKVDRRSKKSTIDRAARRQEAQLRREGKKQAKLQRQCKALVKLLVDKGVDPIPIVNQAAQYEQETGRSRAAWLHRRLRRKAYRKGVLKRPRREGAGDEALDPRKVARKVQLKMDQGTGEITVEAEILAGAVEP